MMDRGTVRNIWSFVPKWICEISASVWSYYKEICYDVGHTNVKLLYFPGEFPDDGSPVPKHVGVATDHELCCMFLCIIVFYWVHCLVYILNCVDVFAHHFVEAWRLSSVTCITPPNFLFLIAACVLLCQWITAKCGEVQLLIRNLLMAFGCCSNSIHRHKLPTLVTKLRLTRKAADLVSL